ncbi:endonuclease/exonuclease/phosphatase family protein [Actinomadura hibisca]|uniref:endonuclease/exonuclease/phosphatase family protein n=1 Tax=Actinomadura hibisca TaxID=68565 RepID=UPI00083240D5|nr:endonuclease/exonuclease/phosphatase family protein [Actinomadura hibisca]
MRVLTLNLWETRGDWPRRRDALAAGLARLDPDLIAFQESAKRDDYDQAADLLGDGYHLAHSAKREPDGQGVTIASRWPLREVREADLEVPPRTADSACTTLLAEVDGPVPLLFANHFPSWRPHLEYEREQQAVIAAREVEAMLAGRDLPVVVAGDMDAAPESASMRFWTGRQSLEGTSVCYQDVWEYVRGTAPGHTYTPANPLMDADDWPFRRIDYILVRRNDDGEMPLRVRDCARVFVDPIEGVQASDHYGISAVLEPRSGAATGPL